MSQKRFPKIEQFQGSKISDSIQFSKILALSISLLRGLRVSACPLRLAPFIVL